MTPQGGGSGTGPGKNTWKFINDRSGSPRIERHERSSPTPLGSAHDPTEVPSAASTTDVQVREEAAAWFLRFSETTP